MKYLEMKSITKSFPGVRALQDVSLSVDEGEIVALVGENGAGKSTLMNVLGGIIKADVGKIFIDKKEVQIHSVADAQSNDIAFIHQELSLFPQLTVRENLFIGAFKEVMSRAPTIISRRAMTEKTREIFSKLEMNISPIARVEQLPMGERQIVEIAAAVLRDAKIIIFDEPTTSLANKERQKLMEIMHELKAQKRLVIYITHDIENALQVSDRIFVMRDGKNVHDSNCEGLTKVDVVKMMIGSKAGKTFNKTVRKIEPLKVVEFRDIHAEQKVNGISLSLRKGEILGLYGLVGAGRTELVRAMYGLNKITSGEILINGKKMKKLNPKKLKKMGVAYLTENRREEGLFLELPLNYNITITDLKKISGKFIHIIKNDLDRKVMKGIIDSLNISTPNMHQLAGKLSGGNQQKVVLGKWLHLNPGIFILDEPTRGIDVGAKNEIYRLIDEITQKGISVILISSEIEEILGMSDRVVIIANGRIAGELEGNNITNENIIKCAMS